MGCPFRSCKRRKQGDRVSISQTMNICFRRSIIMYNRLVLHSSGSLQSSHREHFLSGAQLPGVKEPGHWCLVNGFWWLVSGDWCLVTGFWWLVTGVCPPVTVIGNILAIRWKGAISDYDRWVASLVRFMFTENILFHVKPT